MFIFPKKEIERNCSPKCTKNDCDKKPSVCVCVCVRFFSLFSRFDQTSFSACEIFYGGKNVDMCTHIHFSPVDMHWTLYNSFDCISKSVWINHQCNEILNGSHISKEWMHHLILRTHFFFIFILFWVFGVLFKLVRLQSNNQSIVTINNLYRRKKKCKHNLTFYCVWLIRLHDCDILHERPMNELRRSPH